MKKITIILLTFLYLLPAIGVSVNVHKCGKKVSFTFLYSSPKKKCKCGKKMAMACCKDFMVTHKITDNQLTTAQLSVPATNFIKLFSTTVFTSSSLTPAEVEHLDFTYYHTPPIKRKSPVYISNRVFRL